MILRVYLFLRLSIKIKIMRRIITKCFLAILLFTCSLSTNTNAQTLAELDADLARITAGGYIMELLLMASRDQFNGLKGSFNSENSGMKLYNVKNQDRLMANIVKTTSQFIVEKGGENTYLAHFTGNICKDLIGAIQKDLPEMSTEDTKWSYEKQPIDGSAGSFKYFVIENGKKVAVLSYKPSENKGDLEVAQKKKIDWGF